MSTLVCMELQAAREALEGDASPEPALVFYAWALSVELWMMTEFPAQWGRWRALQWAGMDDEAKDIFLAAACAFDEAGWAAAAVVERELANTPQSS